MAHKLLGVTKKGVKGDNCGGAVFGQMLTVTEARINLNLPMDGCPFPDQQANKPASRCPHGGKGAKRRHVLDRGLEQRILGKQYLRVVGNGNRA